MDIARGKDDLAPREEVAPRGRSAAARNLLGANEPANDIHLIAYQLIEGEALATHLPKA